MTFPHLMSRFVVWFGVASCSVVVVGEMWLIC